MKTIAIEVAREQITEAYLKVPEHWDVNRIRRELTRNPDILRKATLNLDDFDWKNDLPHYHINSICMKPCSEPADYTFKDEVVADVAVGSAA